MSEGTAPQELLIERGGSARRYWSDLWRYRELFYFLAWRDILVRYKQTMVGAMWALIRPLLAMIVLSVVFGRIAGLESTGGPYAILVFSGVLPWQFFAAAIADSGNSLVGNSGLISKVYFPRMTIPASSVITSLVDFLVSAVLLVAVFLYYAYLPPARIVMVPLFVLAVFATAFGAGLWISALTVKYRDFRFIVPFIVQFGMYVSPVAYSSQLIGDRWGETGRLLYSLNPVVGPIDGFRWAIMPNEPLFMPGLLVSLAVTVVLLVSGVWYFRRTERLFADVI